MALVDREQHYVGRAGVKLAYALDHFKINVKGRVAIDFGSSVGGFTGVLLERGVKKVYSVDTAYGQLDWSLRRSSRVVVMERTNALYAEFPEQADLAVIDIGWTTQALVVPKAIKALKQGGEIISLIKPHYEAAGFGLRIRGKRLTAEEAEQISGMVTGSLSTLADIEIKGLVQSPLPGGKGKNIEYFIWIRIK